jgi:hypothetical protein
VGQHVDLLWKLKQLRGFSVHLRQRKIHSMLLTRRNITLAIERNTSELFARVQRLENEQAALRARLEVARRLRFLVAHIAAAAQVAPAVGAAMEVFAESMRAPVPRGRAGGIARARTAWRYLYGIFMSASKKEAAYLAEYERYAVGDAFEPRPLIASRMAPCEWSRIDGD